jgi:hypothetical protein
VSGAIEYTRDSVIVRFKAVPGAVQLRSSAIARVKGSFEDKNRDGVYDRFAHIDRTGQLMKLDLDKTVSVEAAPELLRKDPRYSTPSQIIFNPSMRRLTILVS